MVSKDPRSWMYLPEISKQNISKNKIIGVGPSDSKLYYYDLTAIAVDFSKEMRLCKDQGSG